MEEESKKEKVCESNTPAAGLLSENPPTVPVKKPTPKFSQPLMGLLPTPTIPPLILQPLLGLPAPAILPTIQLSQLLLAAALPKPRIKPLMSFEIPTALQTNLKPNFGTMVQGAPKTTLQTNPQTIKPLMELSVEVPAALKAKLPQFGATKPSVKTRSNTATSQPVDTQPKNKSLLQVTKPAAGPVLESYMSNITSHNPAIKPLMELSVEVPAALKEKFEQFGATMSPVETGSDATDTSLCEDTQPNNESSLQDSIPAAGTDLESSSSNKTRGRNKVKMSRPKSWQRYTSPGGSRYWPRFATRWLDYSRVGNPLRGTPFICFKTPLKPSFDNKVEPKDRFTTDDLMNIVPNLGLVIDLTATDRYNDVSEYRKRGIKYKKVMCQGHVVPNINSVKAFFNAVDEYVMIPQAAGKLIGVHCTHGVNRTGYLVCRYMIQRLGFQPETAISEFEDARGHGIERNEYKDHLKSELENMPFYVRNAGMNRFLKMNFGPKHTDTGIPNLNCRKDGTVELMNAPRNEFVPMNRGTERQTFPPEKEVRSNWQSGPPSQYPETDLRNRLSSNTRIPSSNFFGKESSNEMGPEPPYQKTFYPRSNPGNQQFPAGPSTSGLGAREPGLGPNQTLHPRAGPGPQQILHKDDHFSNQRFYETEQQMGDMGYTRNININYNIGSNQYFPENQGEFDMSDNVRPRLPNQVEYRDSPQFPVDQGRTGILNQHQHQPMQSDEGFSHFPVDQGRSGMPDQVQTNNRDFSQFPVDQVRGGMPKQVETIQRDRNFPQFPADQDGPGMPKQFEPMQRDRDFPPFPVDQGRAGIPKQYELIQRERDFPPFPADHGRPGMPKQFESMPRDRDFPPFPADQGRPGMPKQFEPMPRDRDFPPFPADQGRPGIPKQFELMPRDRDFHPFSADQGRPGMPKQFEPMPRDRDFPPFPVDQGRPGILDKQQPTLSEPPHFPADQRRSELLEKVGSMLKDGSLSKLSIDLVRSGLSKKAGPIQRDLFPADQVRPDMLALSGPMKRGDGPGSDAPKKDGSVFIGHNRPINMFEENSIAPFSSSSSQNMKSAGPNWNAHIESGGLNPGPMTRNYSDDAIETTIMKGRNVPMDSGALDNYSQNPIHNKSIHERLGEHPSRERSNADLFPRSFRSRSRSQDRRHSQNRNIKRSSSPDRIQSQGRDHRRSRSTSRRRSRSSNRSEKRMRMTSRHDGDLFRRRGDVGDRRSRSRDRLEMMCKTYESNERVKEPERVPEYQRKLYDEEIVRQKLEHLDEIAGKVTKAVNVMRTFNFPQEFYDDPKNKDFIFQARKFQSLSNEIQNSLENFNSTFENQQSTSIVSKKTVKLDPSQYKKLQPPPEFRGLVEDYSSEPKEQLEVQLEMKRSRSDYQQSEYQLFRAKYNAPSGY